MLTSKDSHFVDVRLFKDRYAEEKNQATHTISCVDWAFAGHSHTTKPHDAPRESGMAQMSHTVWKHWIDSKSDAPAVDEGDMWIQQNGDVLERGKQKNSETGEETEYEELWHDLEVVPLGKKQNRSSLVMKADDPERAVRGMAVKVGGWCQAILKAQGDLTIERWERRPAKSTDGGPSTDNVLQERTRNDWVRVFRLGKGELPCELMCSNTDGKIGLNTIRRYQTNEDWSSETEWKVLEEYYWQ